MSPISPAQMRTGTKPLFPTAGASPWETVCSGFRLFFQTPWQWILVALILFVLSLAVGLVPFAGLATTIFWPVIAGGIFYAIHRQRATGTFDIGSIFSGFGPRLGQLALVGCVLLLSLPLMIVVFAIFLGSDIAMMFALRDNELDPGLFGRMAMKMLLAFLVYLLIVIPLVAATYLAPALIMLQDLKAGAAMKMSFIGLFKNVLPGLLFGIVMLLLTLIAMIPLGLGLLVTIPVAMIAGYTMYRDIFIEARE
jgi:uncharacterized membrane protein